MFEKIRVYWNLGKCYAEIPNVAKGAGDNAENALKSLVKSFKDKCSDRCPVCWSSNVEVRSESSMRYYIAKIKCIDCGNQHIDRKYININKVE